MAFNTWNTRAKLSALAAAFAVSLTASPALGAEIPETRAEAWKQTVTFGVVPQQSASRLARMWGPLLARLGEELGVKVEFRTTKDIPTFEACLAAGAYDFAYMNPVHYTIFSEAAGYNAVARQSKKQLKGLLVVKRDSPLDTLDDLEGADIAFPSAGAFVWSKRGAARRTQSARHPFSTGICEVS